MPSAVPQDTISLPLTGSQWYIRAGDAEALPVVSALARVMSLSFVDFIPEQGKNEHWRELRVITDSRQKNEMTGCGQSGPVFCLLPPLHTSDRLVLGMSLIGLAIARTELSHGGLLIHGALAAAPENIGGGIILAGHANAGKTTASNRLPPPWRSLCDDTTLIVRDSRGQCAAHPWPTWSSLFNHDSNRQGLETNWNVQNGVPLRAIYFLKQAKKDCIDTLQFSSAVTYLMETVQLVSSLMTWDMSARQTRTLHKRQLEAVEDVIRSIPVYTLYLSLTGSFWKNIEETLGSKTVATPLPKRPAPSKTYFYQKNNKTVQSLHNCKTITVRYSGFSMNPVLRNPEILEVTPYSGKPVQPGDIVYYPSPVDGQKIIHRAVRITPEGIYTSGDNNTEEDSYVVQPIDIIGRVSAAWRHGKRLNISGGFKGRITRHHAILRSRTTSYCTPILHKTYRTLREKIPVHNLLSICFQPKVFEFKHRYQPSIFKILVNGRVIGQYDPCRELWQIDRPWKLMIDQAKLPVVSRSSSL